MQFVNGQATVLEPVSTLRAPRRGEARTVADTSDNEVARRLAVGLPVAVLSWTLAAACTASSVPTRNRNGISTVVLL